ncbi:hypothetical protein COP1_030308 [Malus domestica]
MMGYKTQVVASAIALLSHLKMKRVAGAPLVFIGFYGLTPPYTVANQGGSWLDFVEGSESFKIMVVSSISTLLPFIEQSVEKTSKRWIPYGKVCTRSVE